MVALWPEEEEEPLTMATVERVRDGVLRHLDCVEGYLLRGGAVEEGDGEEDGAALLAALNTVSNTLFERDLTMAALFEPYNVSILSCPTALMGAPSTVLQKKKRGGYSESAQT